MSDDIIFNVNCGSCSLYQMMTLYQGCDALIAVKSSFACYSQTVKHTFKAFNLVPIYKILVKLRFVKS